MNTIQDQASTNIPPMVVYLHVWAPGLKSCPHSEIVDEEGRRVNPFLVSRGGLEPLVRKPPYTCPACADPASSHPSMMTRPRTEVHRLGGVPRLAVEEPVSQNQAISYRGAPEASPAQTALSFTVPNSASKPQRSPDNSNTVDLYRSSHHHGQCGTSYAPMETNVNRGYRCLSPRDQPRTVLHAADQTYRGDSLGNEEFYGYETPQALFELHQLRQNHHFYQYQQHHQYLQPHQYRHSQQHQQPPAVIDDHTNTVPSPAAPTSAAEPVPTGTISEPSPIPVQRNFRHERQAPLRALSMAPHPPHPPRNNHRIGRPCPENDPRCHWHHSDPNPCHFLWSDCSQALRAVQATYYASRIEQQDWKGAPPGWNREHAACYVRVGNNPLRCPVHERCYQQTRTI